MCLIVVAWKKHPDYPLILAANRDEFHDRAAEPMGWWDGETKLLGGRDLQAGGSWLAVSRTGRIAAVTNVRETRPTPVRSRGEIVTGYAGDSVSATDFAARLPVSDYAGFNALLGDRNGLHFLSNRHDDPGVDTAIARPLEAGSYGLSNATLDTPWDKLLRTRQRLDDAIDEKTLTLDRLFDLLADREPAEKEDESSARLPSGIARAASAPFIVSPDYGTRCSTALLWRSDGHIEIAERRFAANGEASGESRFVFIAD